MGQRLPESHIQDQHLKDLGGRKHLKPIRRTTHDITRTLELMLIIWKQSSLSKQLLH